MQSNASEILDGAHSHLKIGCVSMWKVDATNTGQIYFIRKAAALKLQIVRPYALPYLL